MLVNDRELRTARILKGRIEKTLLGGVTGTHLSPRLLSICSGSYDGRLLEYIKEVYKPYECYLCVKLDLDCISALQLEINAESIRRSILGSVFAALFNSSLRRV